MNQSTGKSRRVARRLDSERDLPLSLPDSRTPVTPARFESDVGSRVAGPDDEHVALVQLRWIPVLAGMHLYDPRIELAGEVGTVGDSVGT